MKKRISLFFMMILTAVSVISCQKEVLQSSDMILQTDTENIAVDVYDEVTAFTLSWNEVAAGGNQPTYFVEFANATDNEFVKSVVFKPESTSLVMTNKDLETIHNTIGVVTDYTLVARLRVDAGDYGQAISNQVKINVAINIIPEIEHLYVLGGACNAGWSLGGAEEMTNTDGVFTWKGHLTAAPNGVRFNTTNEDWFPALIPGSEDGVVIYTADDGADYKEFSVSTAGTYAITIDTTNPRRMTISSSLVSAD